MKEEEKLRNLYNDTLSKVIELDEGHSKKLREIDKLQKDVDINKAQVIEWKDKYYMLEYKHDLNGWLKNVIPDDEKKVIVQILN